MASGLRETGRMAWMPVHAGQDHLQQFTRKNALDAIAELVWNGLDAEADLVDVTLETSSLGSGDKQLFHVTKVTVTDNGHGISPQIAAEAFPSLGDSWKKRLSGRTLNSRRILHGSRGRGRFFAYSLGHRVRWTSVSVHDGAFEAIEIEGDQSRIDGFVVGEPTTAQGPTGTTVEISVEQGRQLGALLRDDLTEQLAIRFAGHLLGNADITINVENRKLDPARLIEGDLLDVPLDAISADDLKGHEVPVMTIVDWKDEVRSAPGVVLCNAAGASLIELDNSAPPGSVRSTGYLRWSGWGESGADLLMSQLQHPAVIDAGLRLLAKHVAERTGALQATIVAILKQEDAYPYPEETGDPVAEAEKQMFDLVAVSARQALRSGSRQQRALSARLLQVALQDRPDDLHLILEKALGLSAQERADLADMLRVSSLGSIVRAASEVTRRLDLLSALRHFIYSTDVADEMREVDQLHPLVRDNVWLFGEAWRLSASEVGLTNVIRQVVGEDIALEADLLRDGEAVLLPDGKRGRVDLLLQRTIYGRDNQQSRLVVELKRPSVKLGFDELNQIQKYAQALATHPGAGSSHWSFWLVGSDHKPEIDGQLDQSDREWGHVINAPNYDVRITTWGRLIDDAERRFHFYREQLNYNISQDQAVDRVRQRHEELLPPAKPAQENKPRG